MNIFFIFHQLSKITSFDITYYAKKEKIQEKNYRHYFKYVTIKKINEQFSFYSFFF